MTLRLILIRHAKSDWAGGEADFDRPLNRRGRRDAPGIGRWLAAKGHVPGEVLVSTAARTMETLALLLPELPAAPVVHHRPDLYHAAPETILAALATAHAATVAVIGHNPGIGLLARAMVASAPDHPRFDDYPTAATAVIDLDTGSWSAVRPGTGRCADFAVPGDLP